MRDSLRPWNRNEPLYLRESVRKFLQENRSHANAA